MIFERIEIGTAPPLAASSGAYIIIFFSIYPLFVTAVIDEQEIVKLLEEQEKQSNVNVNFDEIKTEDADIQAQKMHEVADIQPVYQQEDLSNVVSWMAKN